MKKRRTKVPNGRPKPKTKAKATNPASPWRKYKSVPPKPAPFNKQVEIIIGANPDMPADEIEALNQDAEFDAGNERGTWKPDADSLADEIEELENDADREPDEESDE